MKLEPALRCPAVAPSSNNAIGCGCGGEQAAALERRTLWLVLVINAAMFVVELVFGLQGRSTGLIADSLDMLADAGVYALSLLAVGRSLSQQRQAAVLSGRLQIVLAIWVLLDVLRRSAFGTEPISALMVSIGALALLANLLCLVLVRRHREGGVHMRASVIFSTNDTLANLGVIAAGALVAWSGSRLPDLLIGTAISLLVLQGGRRILREAQA
ncbi:MAG: cation transporter [Prochlorococcaceae cyanobacterium]